MVHKSNCKEFKNCFETGKKRFIIGCGFGKPFGWFEGNAWTYQNRFKGTKFRRYKYREMEG